MPLRDRTCVPTVKYRLMLRILPSQLVDIFRVHPNTGCNTHDLLGCPCDQPGYQEDGDTESDDELDQPDAVLRQLKRLGSGFMSASSIDSDAISAMDKAVSRWTPCGFIF